MAKYKSSKIMHSSDLTVSTTQPDISKITAHIVIKYKISKFMSRTILFLIFLGFFSCIAAYFFKNGEEITLLAGILFFGGFASILLNTFLFIFLNQKRFDLQPFAYLVYQVKAIEYASVKEFILPGEYNIDLIKKGINKLIQTKNLKGYSFNGDFIKNEKYQIPADYKNKTNKKASLYELPNLDILSRNVYRFKNLNIFIANHLIGMVIISVIFFFIYLIVAIFQLKNNIRNHENDLLAMKIIFIPFMSYAFILTFLYNIFIANASFKLDYYELIEEILPYDEISINKLSINNIKELPLLKYILKRLIKTKVLKNYYINNNIIYKNKK